MIPAILMFIFFYIFDVAVAKIPQISIFTSRYRSWK